MYSNDQHLLVIGTVEDADPAAFWQAARGAPEKIVFKLFGTWLLEAEDLAALRIYPGHHVPYDAVFAGSVHTLKNQQQRILVRRVLKLLQRTQLLHVLVRSEEHTS